MLLTASFFGCSSSPTTSPRDAADANDTGRKLAPNGESERALLTEAATLPSGAPKRIGNDTAVAEEPYQAASGRTCRRLLITSGSGQPPAQRLACSDGKTWFFVPDVFNRAAE